MRQIHKRFLSLLIVLTVILAMLPTGTAQVSSSESTSIQLYYDDRLPIAQLGGNSNSVVEISNAFVTSTQVGSAAADSAVLAYVDNVLIAVGVGSAHVTIDGTVYTVTVSAAPISLLMITGHSIGSGQSGVAAQSVKNAAGQTYSSHGTSFAAASTTGVGLGYGSASRPAGIDAFASGGVIGEGSGLAYRWNQLTGEKIWVLNTAVGGTSITKWEKGDAAYNDAVAVFRYAQKVLANEIAAGHYVLKNQAVVYHSCANWGYQDNGAWDSAEGEGWYASLLEGLNADLPFDVDGDGRPEQLDGIGLVPTWNAGSANSYGNDRPANFYMAADAAYSNVFMASLSVRTWNRDITTFPDIRYTPQSQAVSKPTTAAALLASDGTHLSQAAYNAAGMDIAENVYGYLRGDKTAQSVSFYTTGASLCEDEIVLDVGESISLIAEVAPIYVGDLSFRLSKNLSMAYPMTITGEADGMGAVTVLQNGEPVKTLRVAVGDTSVPVEPTFPEGWSVSYHCVCGNPASTGNPCANAGHAPVEWKPWTMTNVAPFLAGYWYLPDDLNLTGVTDYKYYTEGSGFATATGVIGRKETVAASANSLVGSAVHVYLDLNGKTITGKSGHRIFRMENDCAHSLTICDTAGGGKLLAMSSATNTNHGMVIWMRGANQLTIYGGTLDATGATVVPAANADTAVNIIARGANIAAENANAILNIYGGKLLGGTLTKRANASNSQFGQGATIFNAGTLNIYGGVICGGTIRDVGTAQGANIRNQGRLNIYGGTITGGTTTGTIGNTQGGNVSNTGTFYMSGGTITGGIASDTDGGNGGSLFTTNGGTMEGGTINAGVASKATGSTSGANNHFGAGIYIYGGNFQMKGGTIKGNRDTNSAYRGGAVYVRNASGPKFTMTGGTVSAGSVADFGGAIGTDGVGTIDIQGGTLTAAFYANGAPITDPKDAMIEGATRSSCAGAVIGTWNGTVTISGGIIIAGNGAGAGGGAISAHGGTKVTISGGKIVGGTASGTNKLYGGTAISVYSSGSKLTMTGGSITGGKGWRGAVHVRNGGAMEISGNAQITGNLNEAGGQANVVLSNIASGNTTTSHSKITIGAAGMGKDAKIGISMEVLGAFTTNAAPKSAFVADSGFSLVENANGTLSLAGHSGENHCICGGTYDGCDHTNLEGEWKPWDGKSAISQSGNYYLTQSVGSSTQYWMGGSASGPAERITINLCTNGHSIDSVWRVFGIAPNVTFNLMNCHEVESVLSGCCATNDHGRVIAVNALSAEMNMYGNIRLVAKETAGRVVPYGGALKVNGKFTMYGGTIVGGYVGGLYSNNGTYTAYDGRGGVAIITDGAQFNIYGGKIYGGNGGINGTTAVTDGPNGKYTARSLGGAFCLDNGASLNIHGGTIYGGNVGDGGVAYASGARASIHITGGTTYAGLAQFGGGAFKMLGGSKLRMTGGIIDGINPERPRDIYNAGAAGGGAILLWDSAATVTGAAMIRNCHTTNNGGAIKVGTALSALTLGGNVQIIGNGKGNVNAHTASDIYLEGGVIMTLDGLTADANVGIQMAAPGMFAKDGASEALTEAFTSNDGSFFVCYGDKGLYLGAPVTMDGKAYQSLAAAMADVKDGSFITLGEDQEIDLTCSGNITLDLNGHDVTGDIVVAKGKTLRLVDSATADYDASDRGMIRGKITGNIARFFNTDPSVYGYNYKYVTVQEEEGWSAHRVYLTVKSVVLNPYSFHRDGGYSTALNYRTVFKSNDVLNQYVAAYGLKLVGDQEVYAAYNSDIQGNGALNSFTTKLSGIMQEGNSDEQNTANAEAEVAACAYILLTDGYEANSAQTTTNLKSVIEKVNTCNTLTEDQKYALGKMYGLFRESMETWGIYIGRIRLCYHENVLGQPIVADKQVALTFDDGPNTNDSMDAMLDLLESYDQKATFFLIGSFINESTAPTVKRAYDAGHELGNHCYEHIRLGELSTADAMELIQKGQDAIAAVTGEAPKYFRYPFGSYTAEQLACTPLPSVSGTSHGDYNAGVTVMEIVDSVMSGVDDGTIILLHVSKGYTWNLEVMHIIIPELRSLGYEITTLDGLFEAQGVVGQPGTFCNRVDEAK